VRQHGGGVQAVALRQCASDVAADGVGCFRQEAQRGAGLLRNPLGQRMQLKFRKDNGSS
jgi:hypothetical protein